MTFDQKKETWEMWSGEDQGGQMPLNPHPTMAHGGGKLFFESPSHQRLPT